MIQNNLILEYLNLLMSIINSLKFCTSKTTNEVVIFNYIVNCVPG